jgi:hypothetical protein
MGRFTRLSFHYLFTSYQPVSLLLKVPSTGDSKPCSADTPVKNHSTLSVDCLWINDRGKEKFVRIMYSFSILFKF